MIATLPSMPMQVSVIHDSTRAGRARRSRSAETGTCAMFGHRSAAAASVGVKFSMASLP